MGKVEKQKVLMAGLEVSRICFGTLTMGPLQKQLPLDVGVELLSYAFSNGVNFFDTAQLYGTYPYLREAIKKIRGKLVISTKSYAYDREDAKQAVEHARKEMDIDEIDIFMMHEQESKLTLAGHRPALEYYLEQKAKGKIKAVGVSTHAVEVVRACAQMPEIDIIHPIVNISGLGVIDGSADEMLEAISIARRAGKGVFAMKPLGGGNLAKSYFQCMDYVMQNPDIHSIAMGMQSHEEIEMNIAVINGQKVSDKLRKKCSKHDKYLNVASWCQGCGRCVEACQFGALTMSSKVSTDISSVDRVLGNISPPTKAVVDKKRCVTCGYCSMRCPVFALKIY